MKLSSSTLCGCCFCCYCHCWLMMLLMVSSVVHVSPEMSTTTTTTTKKYTKLYNNNYAYQSKMTEFLQLNKKIPHTIVATTTTRSSTSLLPSLPQAQPLPLPAITSTDYPYQQNNVNSYPTLEHETITTIATIQTQSTTKTTTTLSTSLHATIQPATAATMMSTLTPAPEQIQMSKQQKQHNSYESTTATTSLSAAKRNSREKRQNYVEEKGVFNTLDKSKAVDNEEEDKEVTTSRTIAVATTMTTTNYIADNSKILVLSIEPTTEPFVQSVTIGKLQQQLNDYSNSNSNSNNERNTKHLAARIDFNPNTIRQKKQEHNGSSSTKTDSSSNYSESSNDFTNTSSNIYNKNSNNKHKQKTTNTFSLNHNNRYGIVNNSKSINTTTIPTLREQNHLTASIENRTTTALNAPAAINSLPSSGTSDFSKSTITHNFKNHNSNNYNIDTSTDSDSYISSKEINQYSGTRNHYRQIPPTSIGTTTTTLRTPATYASSYEHYTNNQVRRPVLLHRHGRQAAGDDEQSDKCRMFIEGDPEKNELFSPDYPNDYPKNINCTRVITAPKGQIIRLDFRNSFHIEEKEECKFDFLEIRDGQYGFSNLIGKYCGTDFPPEITSKERYLWLHFHSDESIEYSGFTAVYEFIDRNRDAPSTDLNCTIERDGFEGFVNATDVPTEIKDTVIRNKIPLDCLWRIQVQEKWKIQVKFIDFKLAKPNDCETNYLDIFPEQTVMPLRVKNFCGSAGEGITSESNILHVRFYAEQSAINSTFTILYTAFRERGSSSCAEDEYDCEDATCIAGNLKCNGRSNCKFLWDEEGCTQDDNGQPEHMIMIITVFGLISGVITIISLVKCVRDIMRDQKIIREHIRQSKESKLDEMGRNSKGRSRENISIVSPRQKHSQTSLQILDDVSNRYYREMELQTKSNFKEKDPSIMRHDMILQTNLSSTDDSSTTTTEQQQQQLQTPSVGVGACNIRCQTTDSLYDTAPLMRQKSKTSSIVGSQRTIEGVPPPPRFSTFGYDAAQIAPPPPPPTVSTLSRRNMHLPQESLEMEQLPQQTAHTMMMMPTHQLEQQQQQQHHPQLQQQHQHLHHRPSQEICHHHHQHQQHLQQQKQTLPRHHQLQQQQQQQLQQLQQPQHHQHMQQLHHHHHTSSATIPTQLTSQPGTAIVTAISAGSSGRQREQQQQHQQLQQGTGSAGGKNKQPKVDESKVFLDIRTSAPDVIIMTSH